MKKLSIGAKKLHAIRRAKQVRRNRKGRKRRNRIKEIRRLENRDGIRSAVYAADWPEALNGFRKMASVKISKKAVSRIDVTIPEVFSFIENPRESIKAIQGMVTSAIQYPKCREILFDHSRLREYDLAAEKVLDHIANQIRTRRRNKNPKLTLSGRFPVHKESARFIRGVGIIRALGLEKKYTRPKDLAALKIFNRANNRSLESIRNPSSMSPKDIATKKYIDHIDQCLGNVDLKLTASGIHQIAQVVGEILDNVIEHSNANDWVVCGYLDSEDENNICELVVFNFGKSISQSFIDLPSTHYMWNIIRPYIKAHESNGLFSSGWKIEDLLTLIALQENISSKNESEEHTRGVGTVDLLEFFQEIYDERCSQDDIEPRMAILSGSTHIVIDGTYRMRDNEHGRRVIAFNTENDLSKTPDRKCFTDLSPYKFPGTAICLRFGLAKNSVKTDERNNRSE